ncbi:hypothetical protein PIB30_067237 [Stylosanthes scabra]|uniref:Transposase MuDR plant domain-containing protein n=1 Tax=Stylosanthes scabra TaxID=79078 RepID=A0ABU6YKP9_9FABA|nr:hypothetical protein [Stylosanthes scabra]
MIALVLSDEDLQVLFHCWQQFPEVRTTKLYVVIADLGASSGGSYPHPQPIHVGPTHCPPDVGVPIMASVESPSFDVNLPQDNDDRCDFDDNRLFGEFAVAIAVAPQPLSPRMGHADPEPLVKEALRCDDSDEKPVMIEGDSDDDEGTIPVSWEAGSAIGPADGGSDTYVHGSISSSVGGKFQIGQTFQSKEKVLLALKNYSIRRGVEYKVFESDHDKYHGKCKEFGNGCNWLIRVTNRLRKGHWEMRQLPTLGMNLGNSDRQPLTGSPSTGRPS